MLRSTTRPYRRMGTELMLKSMEELRAKHAAGTRRFEPPLRGEVNRIQAERAEAHRARADKKVRGCMEVVERIKDLSERVRRAMVVGDGRGRPTTKRQNIFLSRS